MHGFEPTEGPVADTRHATLSQFLLDRWLPARRARGIEATTLASNEWIVATYAYRRSDGIGVIPLALLGP